MLKLWDRHKVIPVYKTLKFFHISVVFHKWAAYKNLSRLQICIKYLHVHFKYMHACIFPSSKWSAHTCHDMQKRQVFGPVSFISWIINAVILTEYCFIYYTLHHAQGREIRGLHFTQKCLCWINITLIYLTKCHKITKMFHNFSRNIPPQSTPSTIVLSIKAQRISASCSSEPLKFLCFGCFQLSRFWEASIRAQWYQHSLIRQNLWGEQ